MTERSCAVQSGSSVSNQLSHQFSKILFSPDWLAIISMASSCKCGSCARLDPVCDVFGRSRIHDVVDDDVGAGGGETKGNCGAAPEFAPVTSAGCPSSTMGKRGCRSNAYTGKSRVRPDPGCLPCSPPVGVRVPLVGSARYRRRLDGCYPPSLPVARPSVIPPPVPSLPIVTPVLSKDFVPPDCSPDAIPENPVLRSFALED